MPLADDLKVGEPWDALLELKVTPNRPDWLSLLGVAREIGAMIGKQVYPPKPRIKETLEHIEGYVQLSVQARHECPRYACRLIRGVAVADSPLWLRRTLEACGLRSINNVVDVTNCWNWGIRCTRSISRSSAAAKSACGWRRREKRFA
jgi:phenylalanyl-tRNA synthetase beta chain